MKLTITNLDLNFKSDEKATKEERSEMYLEMQPKEVRELADALEIPVNKVLAWFSRL